MFNSLTLRFVDPQSHFLFDAADRVRAPGAAIEQADDHLVELVDLFAQRLEAQLFSHRTYRSTSSNNPDDRP
jgi:hypothetical protein